MLLKMAAASFLFFIIGWLSSAFFSSNDNIYTTLDKTPIVLDSASHNDNESYIKVLEDLVADYQQKLTGLEQKNNDLSRELLAQKSQLAALATQPTINKKISEMSDEQVYDKISEFFHENYLKNIDNPKQFASRLSDIALADEDQESIDENGIANVEVNISVSQYPGYQDMLSDQVVVSQYRRLYVNMRSSLPIANALIKWKYLSEDEMIVFKGLSFYKNNDTQYVWARPNNFSGWGRGSYQVNVYQINNELTLLASRTYQVTELIDEGPEEQPDVPEHDGPPASIKKKTGYQ